MVYPKDGIISKSKDKGHSFITLPVTNTVCTIGENGEPVYRTEACVFLGKPKRDRENGETYGSTAEPFMSKKDIIDKFTSNKNNGAGTSLCYAYPLPNRDDFRQSLGAQVGDDSLSDPSRNFYMRFFVEANNKTALISDAKNGACNLLTVNSKTGLIQNQFHTDADSSVNKYGDQFVNIALLSNGRDQFGAETHVVMLQIVEANSSEDAVKNAAHTSMVLPVRPEYLGKIYELCMNENVAGLPTASAEVREAAAEKLRGIEAMRASLRGDDDFGGAGGYPDGDDFEDEYDEEDDEAPDYDDD